MPPIKHFTLTYRDGKVKKVKRYLRSEEKIARQHCRKVNGFLETTFY